MAGHRLQAFFGDDLEETFDSIMSAPGAFGNIGVAALKQVRPIDAVAFGLVVAGWVWLIGGYVIAEERETAILLVSLLPTVLWLAAGIVGGLVFHIGAIGYRSLGYWESYVLIGILSILGVISLRIALDPRGRSVYRVSNSDL
jgi:uncharacterized membrane protein